MDNENIAQGGETLKHKVIVTLVSLLGIGYSWLLVYFDYTAFFCDIAYTNRIKFAIVGAVIAVSVCFLDYFTRKSKITAALGMINMVLLFPMVLLDWGNWPLLIPAVIVTVFGFFCCHMNETAKTVFGTIFLLLYIIGGIAFYFIDNFFFVKTTDTLIDTAVSDSGIFRYYTLNVENKASGKIVVYVQPNMLDKDNGMFAAKTTVKKMIHQESKPAEVRCEWQGEVLYVNGEPYFNESEYAMKTPIGVSYQLMHKNWTYTRFNFDYPLSETIDRITSKVKEYFSERKQREATEVVTEASADTSEDFT